MLLKLVDVVEERNLTVGASNIDTGSLGNLTSSLSSSGAGVCWRDGGGILWEVVRRTMLNWNSARSGAGGEEKGLSPITAPKWGRADHVSVTKRVLLRPNFGLTMDASRIAKGRYCICAS
jgi:hypothetical protein